MSANPDDIPLEAYQQIVDHLHDEVSIEDIWTEDRDEGPVCVVDVHRLGNVVEEALSEYERDLQRHDPRFHFVVRTGRVGRTTIAHLEHPSKKKLTAVRGPMDWTTAAPRVLLSDLSEEPTTPDGWKLSFQTLWDQVILEGVHLKRRGDVTEAVAEKATVVHLRDAATNWHAIKPTGTG